MAELQIPELPGWAVGLLAGLSVAIGGAIKDAPYEGFQFLTFLRSPIVGAVVGWSLERQLHVADRNVLFLATIGGERIIVEGYKLLRAQKPGKFLFGEWGVPKQLVK
ncbi:MAG: hypothetical protein AABN95_14615 [Acidobacteriota bacterium]